MNQYVNRITKTIVPLCFLLLLTSQNRLFAGDGEQLFKANCSSCHKPDKDFTGPALQGARKREPSPDWAYKWVDHVDQMINTDAYAKGLFAKFQAKMTQFDLKEDEIKAILDYADNYKPPAAATKTGTNATAPEEGN